MLAVVEGAVVGVGTVDVVDAGCPRGCGCCRGCGAVGVEGTFVASARVRRGCGCRHKCLLSLLSSWVLVLVWVRVSWLVRLPLRVLVVGEEAGCLCGRCLSSRVRMSSEVLVDVESVGCRCGRSWVGGAERSQTRHQ